MHINLKKTIKIRCNEENNFLFLKNPESLNVCPFLQQNFLLNVQNIFFLTVCSVYVHSTHRPYTPNLSYILLQCTVYTLHTDPTLQTLLNILLQCTVHTDPTLQTLLKFGFYDWKRKPWGHQCTLLITNFWELYGNKKWAAGLFSLSLYCTVYTVGWSDF